MKLKYVFVFVVFIFVYLIIENQPVYIYIFTNRKKSELFFFQARHIYLKKLSWIFFVLFN